MNSILLHRRTLIAAAASLPFVPVFGQVSDLGDAINKAGRQRMLSQRMGKAWLALAHGIEKASAQGIMDKSLSLFDRQLVELKAFATTADIKETYTKLDSAWGEYKAILVGAVPDQRNAARMLQINATVLALAHQGTIQYETVMARPVGKLVNVAGRQRMLSQRMAMYYLAAKVPVDIATATAEIEKARSDFIAGMALLHKAPENTQRINDELRLADDQWVFLDLALKKAGSGEVASVKPMSNVFTASENLLTVMDRVTGMYAALKTG